MWYEGMYTKFYNSITPRGAIESKRRDEPAVRLYHYPMMLPFEDIHRFLRGAARPLLVLVGSTACGKTSLSIEIALELGKERRGVEIVNADSRQLYKFLDIGTAKITPEEMRGTCGERSRTIPHHLLSVLDPKEEVTAAWFKREAERVIAEIHARGNVPFLVGGSMLYVSAIIDNLHFVDRPDESLRAELKHDLETHGADALFARLQELDPEGALSIDPRNEVYLLRALEVCLTSGVTLAEAKKRHASPYDLFIIGKDLPREELHRRIAERTRRMFTQGWVTEVASLLDRGYTADDPGMGSCGYREIAAALTSGASIDAVETDETLRDQISAKTRQYARRQLTWWRTDPRIRWTSE